MSCTVFPTSCSVCGSPLPRLSSVPICAACWSEVPVQSGSACARCGDTLERPQNSFGPDPQGLCRVCRLAAPPFVKAIAYGPYEGRIRDLIHALKYDGLRPAASGLGKLLADAILQLAPQAPAEMLVVPVPLHRAKHAERGFNQARAVAAEALSTLRRQVPGWLLTLAPSTLIRLRATESQGGRTTRQRRLNIRGAFRVSDPMLVAGRHILLVDDILATGATARAASGALLEAGAESVYVATLARAHRIDRAFDRSLVTLESTSSSTEFQAAEVNHRQATMNAQNQPSF